MCIVYSPNSETITFLHKKQSYRITVVKSQTSQGWQWTTLGKEGEQPTKEQALNAARVYILNS